MILKIISFLTCLEFAFLASAADGPVEDMLGDSPGLILSVSQEWGELGMNGAAHPGGTKPPKLQIGEKKYDKGLGTHARSTIVLSLERQYARFDAEIGVQKQSPACGTVVFRAVADGVEIFKSAPFNAQTPPKAIHFPVKGVDELRLVLGDADDGIFCDLGNWAQARLTRDPNAPNIRTASQGVDVSPFARVATWDPKRMDGARAKRTEEFRAEDLFTETELKPHRDGTYTVPGWSNNVSCIGLQWLNSRALRELALEFADASKVPAPESVKVEGWIGESAWQGHWRPLNYELRREDRRLLCLLDRKAASVQTRKIRWILPTASKPLTVRPMAFTRSKWSTTNIFVQVEGPKSGARGKLTVENGAAINQPQVKNSRGRAEIPWSLSKPLSLEVRFSEPSPFKSDPTVLEFRLPTGDVAVGIEDVLENDCVYLPDHGLFVAREPLPVTLEAYKQRIAGKKTILEEVRAMPDQTFEQAMAKTHHDYQREGIIVLSLSCDNTKFIMDRYGGIRNNGGHAKHGFADRIAMRPRMGNGLTNVTRRLEGRWLPIAVLEWRDGPLQYRQRAFVAPVDEPGENPTRLNRPSVCVVELTATNSQPEAADASIVLTFQPPTNGPVQFDARQNGWRLDGPDGRLGFIATNQAPSLAASEQNGVVKLAGKVPGNSEARCVVFLTGEGDGKAGTKTVTELRDATESYWKAMLAPAAQIETPDELLNDVIRSSQVRCLIAGRNEADGDRIAAWIAAVTYGPLESESHSIIRGMDFLGHHDFARKSLDFFIHRYNTNGFLTTGYTTFGTAWHLWTVGEHYRLHRDKTWLKRVAPEVARVCHWIVRQTEKTKKLDARGEPVPEYGLMPPGVLADWNSFAYHFCMNAYYVAALREAGRALKDIGHPDAQFFINQSEELRKNSMRAYAWTQSRAPAMPLRNGTWIAHYPSQVHSPGELADFFPGQDAGRSWCYNVELGAHQLVPAGVLQPRSPEVVQMMNHMEDVQFLADGWFDYPAKMNHADWFNNGGFSKVQPYYTRNGEIYAMQDEVKPFIRSYFNSIASLLNPEILTFWEHFRHSGAPDKTHETGYFLQQTRFMVAMEHGNELWLAPLVTSNWLKDGMTLSATKVPTLFGNVNFRINSQVNSGAIEAHVEPPARFQGKAIVLRLRHPEGKSIRNVTVNGKAHKAFDTKLETITLNASKRLDIRAEY